MPTNPKQMRKEARRSAPPPESSSSSLVSVEFIADEAPFDPRRLDLPLPPPLQARKLKIHLYVLYDQFDLNLGLIGISSGPGNKITLETCIDSHDNTSSPSGNTRRLCVDG